MKTFVSGHLRSTATIAILLAGSGALLHSATRTVPSSEIGNLMMIPNGYTWSELGAYDSYPTNGNFSLLPVDTLKAKHGRLTHFMPADENAYAYFPYNELKSYDAQQVAAGKSPLFVTAYYQGKHRPVYFSWSLGLNSSQTPTANSSMWMQAVNISDSRFITFFVNNYVYGRLWPHKTDEEWVSIDNGTFIYSLYGVLDNNNHFVSNVTWDEPYAQNNTDFQKSVETFFSELKVFNPEIAATMMVNSGSLLDWTQFPSLYANIAGLETESITNSSYDTFSRGKLRNELYYWWGYANILNRPCIFRSEYIQSGNSSSLITGVVSYMLIRGVNTFFAPEYSGTSYAVPPADYASIFTKLGTASGSLQISTASGAPAGNALYTRTYQHGIVYLNWTGASQTIQLPSGHTYSDVYGNTVTHISLSDLTGTYVLYK